MKKLVRRSGLQTQKAGLDPPNLLRLTPPGPGSGSGNPGTIQSVGFGPVDRMHGRMRVAVKTLSCHCFCHVLVTPKRKHLDGGLT